jgi:hypothetical protein
VKDILFDQRAVCSRYGVEFVPAPPGSKLGVAREVRSGIEPLHGLRHPVEASTCGWYLWAGEWNDAEDFFEPLHVAHLSDRCPELLPYLGLPPGWRFLLADNVADVWFDAALLDV